MLCLVVDDHPLTRDGTAVALGAVAPDLKVLEADSLAQAREVLQREPDIELVLLDLDLGDSQGVATLEALKDWCIAREIDARIVVLSGHCEPDLVRDVIDHYATGFILKATPKPIFQQAVSLTLAGGVYIPDVVLRQIAPPPPAPRAAALDARPLNLTPRETEVAALLVQGYTYKRIAKELERRDGSPISDHTVRAHVGNIAWKLGVTENAKAGVMAEIARRGLKFPR